MIASPRTRLLIRGGALALLILLAGCGEPAPLLVTTAPPPSATESPATAEPTSSSPQRPAAAETSEPPVAKPRVEAASVFEARDGDWPLWGGSPARNMVNAREKGIPTTWDLKTRKNIKWVAQLGSLSYGNPVVAHGKVLVGTNNRPARNPMLEGDKGVMLCLSADDGQLIWQAAHDKLASNGASDWPEIGIGSSCCVEGDRVYYVSNRAELVCADLNGFTDGENNGPFKDEKATSPIDADFIWLLDMIEDLGVSPHYLATSSPLIVNDLVYVHTSNGVGKDGVTVPSPRAPSFIAVDKRTGKLVWGSNAPGEGILDGQWSSPSFSVAGGRPQVIFPGGDGWVRSFDPLKGDLLWAFDLNPMGSIYDSSGKGTRTQIVATAVCVGDRVYVGQGQDPEHGDGIGRFYSIDATKSGDVTGSAQVWQRGGKDFRRTISTAAVKDGLVFAVDLNGVLQCLDQETGSSYWAHDMLAAVWGSPMWIDGNIYLGDEDGDLVVLKADKKLQVLSEINMENAIYSTPVAAGGVLFVANRASLFAIQEK